jgi:hypothetical protein
VLTDKPHVILFAHPTLLRRMRNFGQLRFPSLKNRLDRNHDITGATFILEGPMQVHIRLPHP